MKKVSFIIFVILLLLSPVFSLSSIAEENPPPGSPQNLTFCNLTKSSVRLKWTSPGDTDIVHYNVYKNDQHLYSPILTTYDVTHLESNTLYTFKVNAYDGVNAGPFSNTITITTESEGSKDGNATGSITYPVEGERYKTIDEITGTAEDIDGTVMEAAVWIIDSQGRYLSPNLTVFETAQDPLDYLIPVQNTGTNYSIWSLDLSDCQAFIDGQYTAKLCVSDGIYNTDTGQQVNFIIDTTPPLPPQQLSADEITSAGLKLSWQSSSSGDTQYYNVYMNDEFYGSTFQIYVDVNGLSANTLYSFYVTAHDGLNQSQLSTTHEIVTLPASPGNAIGIIEYPEDGARQASLDKVYGKVEDDEGIWGAWLEIQRDEDGYFLNQNLDEFVEYPSSIQVVGKTCSLNEQWEIVIPEAELIEEGSYTVTLKVYDSEINNEADRINFCIDTIPPLPPQNLRVLSTEEDRVTIEWNPVEDNYLQSYYVYLDDEDIGTTTCTTYTIENLEKDVEHTISIKAWDGLHLSAYSQPLKLTISSPEKTSSAGNKKSHKKYIRKYLIPLDDETFKVKVKVWDECLNYKVRQKSVDRFIVDTTNYFPGKQISQEAFWIEDDLILKAINEGQDIVLKGRLGILELKTSEWKSYSRIEDLEITLKKENYLPSVKEFITSHKGFTQLSDTLSINFNNFPKTFPITLTVDTLAKPIKDGSRTGILRFVDSCCLLNSYDKGEVNALNVQFDVEGPGIYACVSYKNPYCDIEGHWAEDYINKIMVKGLHCSVSDVFFPDEPVTHGDFTDIACTALRIEFQKKEYWDRYMTRGELAEYAVNIYNEIIKDKTLKLKNVEEHNETSSYFDTIQSNNETCRNVDRAVLLGLMRGFNDGNFYPDEYATRAQAIVVLCRLINLLNDIPMIQSYTGQ